MSPSEDIDAKNEAELKPTKQQTKSRPKTQQNESKGKAKGKRRISRLPTGSEARLENKLAK